MADPAELDEEGQEEEEKGGAWLTTWADMMSVLLTFFIVLQAFSTISERKFQLAVESIREAFSVTLPVTSPGVPSFRQRDTTAEEMEESLAKEDVEGISVQDFGDRMVLTVDSAALFQLGDADLTGQGKEVIRQVAKALQVSKGRVRIEGHTCDLRPGLTSDYPNNWWLSTARALTVLEALERTGIPAERMVAAGHAENDPLVPNDGEANRRRNRRVEFVIEKTAPTADKS